MPVRRVSLRLPVIPPPPNGTASVFVAGDGFEGPFFNGDGPIDLVCGQCLHTLCHAMHPGQMENLVLLCPSCKQHNIVISIPSLESFVAQTQALPTAAETINQLKTVLQEAQEKKSSQPDVMALVEQVAPDLSAIKELLVPKTPGDFYGLLGFVIGFLAWLQSRKPSQQQPSVVINNYFSSQDPFKGAKANSPCPCGSGKKYKKCHGR